MIDDTSLRRIASKQHGLVSLEQLIDAGISKRSRQLLIDGRRWERVGPRVVRLVGAPPSAGQLALRSVLSAGVGAALHGSSACAWWGVPGNLLQPVQLVRWRDRSCRAPVGAVAHEPKVIPDRHVVTLDGVPTVVPARALFDVAGSQVGGAKLEWWVDRIARMVDTAWSMRLVSGPTLHGVFDDLARRGRSGTATMRMVLDTRPIDYVPPASGLESRLAQLVERAGLPSLRRQVDVGDTRWIGRVDFRDPVLPLVVEVQSERFHRSQIDVQLDATRVERLEAAGLVVVEVIDTDVWHRPSRAVRAIAEGRELARRRAAA